MKHISSRILSLLLSFVMLLSLMPSAFAAESLTSISSVPDIELSPSSEDGNVRFGEAGDISTLSASGDTYKVELSAGSDSLKRAIQKTFEAAFAAQNGALLPNQSLELESIGYISVTATQGTLYDGYNTEGDTGIGVAGATRYYFDQSQSSTYLVRDIRFVPNPSFTGRALITYYGYYKYTTVRNGETETNRASFNGRIYISVSTQKLSISYSTDGEPVRFSADDFNAFSVALTGRAFRYVSFTPPSASRGKLYYNYISDSIYEYEATSSSRFYRTGAPQLENLYFVPKENASATKFQLPFTGYDIAEKPISGSVTITITAYGPQHAGTSSPTGGFTYELQPGASQYITDTDAFVDLCQDELGSDYTFDSIRFMSLPSSREGTLYRGGGTSNEVDSRTNYYNNSSSNSISNVRFQAYYNFEGTVTVPFRGYATHRSNGAHRYFDGELTFIVSRDSTGNSPLHYTVDPGKTVYFEQNDFVTVAGMEMDYSLNRITIDALPNSSDGSLYYLDGSNVNRVRAGREYTRSNLSYLHFAASDNFTGSISIPFTGYDSSSSSSRRHSFGGNIVIESTQATAPQTTAEVTGGTTNPITYYTSQFPVFLRAEDIISRASSALPGAPATVVLTRPDDGTGTLCSEFVTLSQYTAFDHRKSYPISDISRVAFLPKAGFSGATRINYTVSDAKGNSFMGAIDFFVMPPNSSNYFVDLANHAWAVPAVDFFRFYNVTKGVSPKYFGPDHSMRRGDFVLLLSRACGFPSFGTESFEDVPEDRYYAAAIASAKSLGIVTGSADGIFFPDGTITREEAATYLFRALQRYRGVEAGTAADLARFADAEDTASVAVPAMGALVRLGIIDGVSGYLLPGRVLTRAETITILYRAFT